MRDMDRCEGDKQDTLGARQSALPGGAVRNGHTYMLRTMFKVEGWREEH